MTLKAPCNFRKTPIKLCYFSLTDRSSGHIPSVLHKLVLSKYIIRKLNDFLFIGRRIPTITYSPFYKDSFDNYYGRLIAKFQMMMVDELPSVESYQSQKYKVEGG